MGGFRGRPRGPHPPFFFLDFQYFVCKPVLVFRVTSFTSCCYGGRSRRSFFGPLFLNFLDSSLVAENLLRLYAQSLNKTSPSILQFKKCWVKLACVAGVQRGGRGEVECEREARSFGHLGCFHTWCPGTVLAEHYCV